MTLLSQSWRDFKCFLSPPKLTKPNTRNGWLHKIILFWVMSEWAKSLNCHPLSIPDHSCQGPVHPPADPESSPSSRWTNLILNWKQFLGFFRDHSCYSSSAPQEGDVIAVLNHLLGLNHHHHQSVLPGEQNELSSKVKSTNNKSPGEHPSIDYIFYRLRHSSSSS